tara:strand:+ start:2002 stop:2616 length:615 start_codon:yes stop_codon:yes gene_type:complete
LNAFFDSAQKSSLKRSFYDLKIQLCSTKKLTFTPLKLIIKDKMQNQIKHWKKGTFLFQEGEEPKSLYLIKEGTVSVRKAKGDAFVELARIHSGEVVGELSFFDREPRSAAAVTLSDVKAMEIEFSSLDAIYAKVPDYLKTIIRSVADRLRRANETIRRLQKKQVYLDEIPQQKQIGGQPNTSSILAAVNDSTFNPEEILDDTTE